MSAVVVKSFYFSLAVLTAQVFMSKIADLSLKSTSNQFSEFSRTYELHTHSYYRVTSHRFSRLKSLNGAEVACVGWASQSSNDIGSIPISAVVIESFYFPLSDIGFGQ
jgi:hypothetical protein